jgi:hypothetical protein
VRGILAELRVYHVWDGPVQVPCDNQPEGAGHVTWRIRRSESESDLARNVGEVRNYTRVARYKLHLAVELNEHRAHAAVLRCQGRPPALGPMRQ